MSDRYQEPEFLPWDGRRVPLTFVAGYLGAGKTTLINATLAATDRPIAVIVNDVGEINIDAKLVRKHSGDTIELSNGCVCCSLVDGFGAAFDQIRSRPEPPDHVVVELSGVAEPERVIPWGRSAGFQLDGIMTVVAADQFAALVDRRDIGGIIRSQITAADMVVINKCDLVDDGGVDTEHAIADMSTDVPIIRGIDADATAALLRIGGRRPGGVTDIPEVTLFDHHTVTRVSLPNPIEPAEIELLLNTLEPGVMRAKGIAIDNAGSHWLIQVVGRRQSITPLADVELEAPTDLVVISLG